MRRWRLRLVRNHHFRPWSQEARPDGFANEIAIDVGGKIDAQPAAVRNGDADVVSVDEALFAGTLEPARLHPLAIQYGGQLHSAPEPQLEYMQMNVRLPAFDDARVRRALNYAVDRGEVAELARRRVSVPHGIGGRRPKRLSLEMQLHADWAITLACGARCPYVSSTVEDWDVADPAGEPIEEVRKIRDDIEQRVLDLVENKMDLIRQDRRQHQLRMSHLVPGLVKEFGDRLTGEEIRSIADDILDTYDDVPVRSFVMTLANRRAREILKARAGETVGTA